MGEKETEIEERRLMERHRDVNQSKERKEKVMDE